MQKEKKIFIQLNNHFILRVIQQLSKWKHNEILKAIAEWSLYTMDSWFSSLLLTLYSSLVID